MDSTPKINSTPSKILLTPLEYIPIKTEPFTFDYKYSESFKDKEFYNLLFDNLSQTSISASSNNFDSNLFFSNFDSSSRVSEFETLINNYCVTFDSIISGNLSLNNSSECTDHEIKSSTSNISRKVVFDKKISCFSIPNRDSSFDVFKPISINSPHNLTMKLLSSPSSSCIKKEFANPFEDAILSRIRDEYEILNMEMELLKSGEKVTIYINGRKPKTYFLSISRDETLIYCMPAENFKEIDMSI